MRRIRRAAKVAWMTTAILAVAFALMLSSVRLLLPLTQHYRAELQEWITEALGRPVEVGRTAARWNRFGPELALFEVVIRDPENTRSVLRFAEMHIGIDLLTALWHFDLQPTAIRVIGSQLEIERLANGRIQVQGIAANTGTEQEGDEAGTAGLAWLFTREHLLLEDLDLTLIDQRRDPKHVRLADIDIELRNNGDRHQLAGRVQLTSAIGDHIEFAANTEGEANAPSQWQGEVFLSVSGLKLAQLARQIPDLQEVLQEGSGNLLVWGNLSQGKLAEMVGRVELAGLEIQNGELNTGYPAITGDFVWRREADGWSGGVNRLILDNGRNAWPASTCAIRWREAQDGQPTAMAATLSYLPVEPLVSLAVALPMVPEEWRTRLVNLQPEGAVENLATQFVNRHPAAYQVAANVHDLGVRRWERFPGATGVSGRLQLDQDGGNLRLNSDALTLELSRWFEQSLPAIEAEAQIAWERTDTGWQFGAEGVRASNADARTVAVAAGEWHRERGVFLDISAHIEEARGSNVSPYLPTKRMPVNTVKWLRRSIVDGHVPGGAFVYRGWGRSYPFLENEGRFHIAFDVEEAVLDYLPEWPRIEGIKANVEFEQASMRIHAETGRSLGVVLSQARADIPNLKRNPTLSVSGNVSTSVVDAVNFLAQTPLTGGFRDTLQELRVTGAAQLELAIDARLKEGAIPRVNGVMAIDKASVAMPGWPAGADAIKGELRFTEHSLTAKGMTARVLKGQAQVDVDVPLGARAKTAKQGTVSARGAVQARELSVLLDHPISKALAGTTKWHAVWQVPSRRGQKNRVEVTSNLQGFAVDLPAPFGKTVKQTTPLNIIVDATQPKQSTVTVRYHQALDAALRFSRGRTTKLARGEVRLGGGTAFLPTEPGVLVSGDIERLPVSDWRRALGGWGKQWDLGATPIQRVVLRIGELILNAKVVKGVRLAVAKEEGYWQGFLAGDGAKGSVRIPLRVSDSPLVLSLDYLKLISLTQEEEEEKNLLSNPRNLPPLEVKIDRLWLDEEELGELMLRSIRVKEGVRIPRFQVSGKTLTVEAQGDWLGDGQRNRSTWEASLKSPDLGKALRTLGYAEGIKGGKTEANVQLSWPGPPSSPDFSGMRGRVSLSVKSGRIVDLDPGAGRIFGLLSVQALPRRLILDFRDLFLKGFTFDEITGQFRIDSGDAYSDDLLVVGPAAKLKVIGRTGLARRDYDQLVKVDPNLAGTLPLAGWAVGGPTVGAVLLFFQKMLGKDFDESSGIYYRVTGSWNAPEVVRVQTEGSTRDEPDPSASNRDR